MHAGTARDQEKSLSKESESILPPESRRKTPNRKGKELVRNTLKRRVRFEENKETSTTESSRLVLRSGRISRRIKKARGTKTTL